MWLADFAHALPVREARLSLHIPPGDPWETLGLEISSRENSHKDALQNSETCLSLKKKRPSQSSQRRFSTKDVRNFLNVSVLLAVWLFCTGASECVWVCVCVLFGRAKRAVCLIVFIQSMHATCLLNPLLAAVTLCTRTMLIFFSAVTHSE